MTPLTRTIKDQAVRLGFPLAGITTTEPPPHWPVFQDWLAKGRHGGMAYLADQRRADPRRVLPDCRSILMLAARYPNPGPPVGPGRRPNRGRLAAYARGRDYHLVLPERLEALVDFIEAEAGRPILHRIYTDTGPLLERDLAQRAGMGWIGKNTCLINPGIGSYFYLAEILLGFDLEPDPPFDFDRCGRCQRCIDACPTGCILPDRTIDARRCISYLTIENKAGIPVDLRAQVGDWVFGCDLCQQVCPWNRQAGDEPLQGLDIPNADQDLNLIAELELTRQEFDHRYHHTPLQRTRYEGYCRNLAVALGNVGDQQAVQVLEKTAAGTTSLVAEPAAWALENIRRK